MYDTPAFQDAGLCNPKEESYQGGKKKSLLSFLSYEENDLISHTADLRESFSRSRLNSDKRVAHFSQQVPGGSITWTQSEAASIDRENRDERLLS